MSRPWCVNNNAALILRLSNDLEFRKENDLGKGARATQSASFANGTFIRPVAANYRLTSLRFQR
jgi:hypothetical protein